MELLERTWRANFAARAAQGGLRGNNNTDLARAMRAWIAFRDEEEREKKEKEQDARALDVRRRRLHELETERLGLTVVCRYDTRVITEDEEIGPHGIETNERQYADGDDSNPILVDDEPDQTEIDPLEDLEPPKPSEQPSAADQIAPIVELLRKRQREEREEADIRREEQILLIKRLAMMEEQVQMLSKLMTQRNLPLAPTSPQVDVESNKSADVAAEPDVEAETAATSGAIQDAIVIDDGLADHAVRERSDTSNEPGAVTETVQLDADTHTDGPDDDDRVMHNAVDAPADVSMGNSAEQPAAGLETTTSNSMAEPENDAAAGSPAVNAHGAIDAVTEAMKTSTTTEQATAPE